MKFLRTASTARLLAALAALLGTIAAGAAIAVAATSGGPVPPARPLSTAIHSALSAAPVSGVSADITFTDNLIDSSDFTGQATDPLLQGGSGRMWWSAGSGLRLELQSDDGDSQVIVRQGSYWVSDPAQNVVYEGTLPAGQDSGAHEHGVPTVAAIKAELSRVMGSLDVGGAQPTDVAGRPAYSVSISPKTDPGLVGSAALAWDAARGVPLSFALYARGDAQPVLALSATHISFGPVPSSVFTISPPAGARVVTLGTPHPSTAAGHPAPTASITGTAAVASHVSFTLHAPATAGTQPLRSARLIGAGPKAGASLVYGQGLGAVRVIETPVGSGKNASGSSAGGSVDGLSLPTRTIDGASATVLSTPLGSVLRFSSHGVSYTVFGSITAAAAQSAATQIAASP